MARVVRAVGERLFGQKMAMMGKRGERNLAPGRRNHDVEHCVGLGLVEHSVKIGSDNGAGKLIFARPRFRPVGVEVD